MNDFEKSMSDLPDEALVKIVTILKDDYQPEAVLAAKNELNTRKVSADKISSILSELENPQSEHNDSKKIGLNIKSWRDIIDPLNPSSDTPIDRRLQLIFFVFLILYLYFLIDQWQLLFLSIKSLFENPNDEFILLGLKIDFLLPYVLFPLGLFGYWKNKRFGWIILMMILLYWLLNLSESLYMYYKYSALNWDYLKDYGDMQKKMIYLLYMQNGWFYYVLRAVICLLGIYYLSLKQIRQTLGISRRYSIVAVIIPILIYFFIIGFSNGMGHFHF